MAEYNEIETEVRRKMVKIVDIHKDDGYFFMKDQLIGSVGTFEPTRGAICPDGYNVGNFLSIDREVPFYFIAVKVENVEEGSVKIKSNMTSWACGEGPEKETEAYSFMPGGITVVGPTSPTERHGHPDFYKLCEEEMELHSRKNHDYSFGGNPMGNFYRVATILNLYPGLALHRPAVVSLVYMAKQLDAIMWMLSHDYHAKTEGISDRLRDISVYAKLMEILLNEEKKNQTDDKR